jgi:hypothetical protein
MSPAVWHKTKGGGHRGNQHPRWYHHQNDSKLKVQTKLNQQHPYRQQVRKHLQKVQPKLNQQHPYRQQVQKNHQKHHPYPAQLNALQAQQCADEVPTMIPTEVASEEEPIREVPQTAVPRLKDGRRTLWHLPGSWVKRSSDSWH